MTDTAAMILREAKSSNVKDHMIITTGERTFRVLSVSSVRVCVIEMYTKRMIIENIPTSFLSQKIISGEYTLFEEIFRVLDLSRFSEVIREKYHRSRQLMDIIERFFHGEYEKIPGSLSLPEIQSAAQKLHFSDYQLRRTVRQYLQSGRSELSLIDGKALRTYDKRPYIYSKMPGNFSHGRERRGCVLTAHDQKNFEAASRVLSSPDGKNKKMTVEQAYRDMVRKYYTVTIYENNSSHSVLKEHTPSIDQFRYYVRTNISKIERTSAQYGSKYMMNNFRLFTGNERSGIFGPGDTFEIDAYETNIAIMEPNPDGTSHSIGRAILYLIIDVYTLLVVGMYVGLENNSFIGLTNVLYNLAENKEEFIARSGLKGSIDPHHFVTGYKPLAFRVDNGSEFVSDEFRRICNELSIEILTVPPGTGSMKSAVEHTFYQLQTHYEVFCYKKGCITTEHESRHHKETPLTLEDANKILIVEISRHNSSLIKSRMPDKDMIDHDIPAIPIEMWNFYMETKPAARLLPEATAFVYTLAKSASGRVSRDRAGIEYEGLLYSYTCPEHYVEELVDLAYKTDRKPAHVEIRIDPRSVNYIYYLDKKFRLHTLFLNENVDTSICFKGLSWKKYDDYLHAVKGQRKKAERESLLNDLNHDGLLEDIIKAAAKDHKGQNDTSDIRSSRARKKEEAKSKDMFISGTIAKPLETTVKEGDNRDVLKLCDHELPDKAEEQGSFLISRTKLDDAIYNDIDL